VLLLLFDQCMATYRQSQMAEGLQHPNRLHCAIPKLSASNTEYSQGRHAEQQVQEGGGAEIRRHVVECCEGREATAVRQQRLTSEGWEDKGGAFRGAAPAS
jgi:hypothetical protein